MRSRASPPLVQGLDGPMSGAEVQRMADSGVKRARAPLPHAERIARAFGANHNIGGVRVMVGGPASAASKAMGTTGGYATRERIAFAKPPSLRVAAHEAAHIIQQRSGLAGGVGRPGDAHERHADAVADRVVRGQSASDLLARYAGPASKAAEGPTAMPTGPAPGAPVVQLWQGLSNAAWMRNTGRWKSIMLGGIVRHMTAENLKLKAGKQVGAGANPPTAKPRSWGRLKGWKMVHPSTKPGYVRMHMLSDRLGGPGDEKENLAPGTNAMNQKHFNRAEKKLIGILDGGGEIFKYTVQADYQFPSGKLNTAAGQGAWQETLRRLFWRAKYQTGAGVKKSTFGVVHEKDNLDTKLNWTKH